MFAGGPDHLGVLHFTNRAGVSPHTIHRAGGMALNFACVRAGVGMELSLFIIAHRADSGVKLLVFIAPVAKIVSQLGKNLRLRLIAAICGAFSLPGTLRRTGGRLGSCPFPVCMLPGVRCQSGGREARQHHQRQEKRRESFLPEILHIRLPPCLPKLGGSYWTILLFIP